MNLIKLFFPVFLLALSFQTFAKIEIDLLVYYSKDVKRTQVDHLVNTTNTIYQNSYLDINLRVVEYLEVDLTKTTSYLSDLQQEKGPFKDVNTLREKYGADMVTVISKFIGEYGKEHCGGTSTPTSTSDLKGNGKLYFTTSAAPVGGSNSALAHVLGHNMGLMHSPKQGGKAIYKYARGWGVDKEFHTVMALSKDYNTHNQKLVFSDPKRACTVNGTHYPCGNAGAADAVKAIRETAPIISDVFSTKIASGTITNGSTYFPFRRDNDSGTSNKTEDKEYPVGSLGYLIFALVLILFYRLFCKEKD